MTAGFIVGAAAVTGLVAWAIALLAWSVALVQMRREHDAFARRLAEVTEKMEALRGIHEERFESLQDMYKRIATAVHGLNNLASLAQRTSVSVKERIQ